LKWYRFKRAPRRSAWSGVEPDQADIRILMIKLRPDQAVSVGPTLAALATEQLAARTALQFYLIRKSVPGRARASTRRSAAEPGWV